MGKKVKISKKNIFFQKMFQPQIDVSCRLEAVPSRVGAGKRLKVDFFGKSRKTSILNHSRNEQNHDFEGSVFPRYLLRLSWNLRAKQKSKGYVYSTNLSAWKASMAEVGPRQNRDFEVYRGLHVLLGFSATCSENTFLVRFRSFWPSNSKNLANLG